MIGYTVNSMNDCKVVKGSIPVADLTALLNAWCDEWVADGELARALCVNLVVGPPARISAWREQLGIDGGKP